MFRIAICEDDHQHIEAIMMLMKKYRAIRPGLEMHIYSFNSGYSLMDDLNKGRDFDLFLLEVLMAGMNGIELAKELRLRSEDTPLVFLTCSTEHALDAFRVHATQYILKPVKEEYLFPVLDQIFAMLMRKQRKYLLFSTSARTVKIPFSSIVCVESINRTLRVYLANGTKLQSKTLRVRFTTAVTSLLQDARFLHAHNSFLLNMDWVKEASGNCFIMEGGTEVPVPRYKLSDAKAKYLDYLSAKGIDLIDRQKHMAYAYVTI